MRAQADIQNPCFLKITVHFNEQIALSVGNSGNRMTGVHNERIIGVGTRSTNHNLGGKF
jgi:hypothetical protein